MSDTTETQDSFLDFEKELLGDNAAVAEAVVEAGKERGYVHMHH